MSARCSSLATKNELWMWRDTAKRLFSTDPQLGAASSLRCQVISPYLLVNLTAAGEACGHLKETLLFRLFSSSFTQTDIQEADGSLHTAPYFLNSSVTGGLSGPAKRAQITSKTLAVIFSTAQSHRSYQTTNVFRAVIKHSALIKTCQSEENCVPNKRADIKY